MISLPAATAAAAFLAGSTLVALFLRRKARAGLFLAPRRRLAARHAELTAALVRRGFLRFPGIRLVEPGRCWAAGEAVALAAAALLLPQSGSAAGAAMSLCASPAAGVATTVLLLRDASRRRLDDVRRALPTASFLLSLLLEAGLGPHAALEEVAAALPPGPLPGELGEIARNRSLGMPRAEALEQSGDRVPLDDYLLFLNLVRQGEQLGVGLSRGLRELSVRMMESQEHRAEAMAQRAAVKLLFPLMAFIFPAVVLIILSPVILSLLGTWGSP